METIELKLANCSDELWADRLLRQSPECGVSSVRSDSLEHHEVVYLVLDAGQRVGFLTYRTIGDQLFNLFISPDHRKQGLGRLAVARLFYEMRASGVVEITVNSVSEAVAFWERTFHRCQVRMEGENKFIVSVSAVE